MNEFKEVFEMYDVQLRRLQAGHKLRLVFSKEHDIEEEKKWIEFRDSRVEATIAVQKNPESAGSVLSKNGHFECFDVFCKRLKNGNKLIMYLECSYEKAHDLSFTEMKFNNVIVGLKKIEEELAFEEDQEENTNEDDS